MKQYKITNYYNETLILTRKELFSFFDNYFRFYYTKDLSISFRGDFSTYISEYSNPYYFQGFIIKEKVVKYLNEDRNVFVYTNNFYKLESIGNKNVDFKELSDAYYQSRLKRKLSRKPTKKGHIFSSGSKSEAIKRKNHFKQKKADGLKGELKNNISAKEQGVTVRSKRAKSVFFDKYEGRPFKNIEKNSRSWKDNKKIKKQWQKNKR